MMNDIKHYPLSILTTLVVVGLSLFPIGPVEMVEGVPLVDKWTHMVMYAGLTAVICWETIRRIGRSQIHSASTRGKRGGSLLFPFLYAIALGGIMELMQAFCTSYRSGEWLDFVADSIGALFGVLIGCLFLLVRNRKR